MSPCLLGALCCPKCHGELTRVRGSLDADGALGCAGCAREFAIEGGLPILADRAYLERVCDRWPGGTGVGKETARRPSRDLRNWAAGSAAARFLDAMAAVRGLVVDIATGPSGSFSSLLVPRLAPGTQFVMTDASILLLKELQAAWAGESQTVQVDFIGLDANELPLRDSSLDAITSRWGFGCAWEDPERQRPSTLRRAYREAHRALRSGGFVFDLSLYFGEGTRTAAWLDALDCEDASRSRLEGFLRATGFEIVSAETTEDGRGKLHAGDMVPLDESDTWSHVAYVLRKP